MNSNVSLSKYESDRIIVEKYIKTEDKNEENIEKENNKEKISENDIGTISVLFNNCRKRLVYPTESNIENLKITLKNLLVNYSNEIKSVYFSKRCSEAKTSGDVIDLHLDLTKEPDYEGELGVILGKDIYFSLNYKYNLLLF